MLIRSMESRDARCARRITNLCEIAPSVDARVGTRTVTHSSGSREPQWFTATAPQSA